MTSIRNIFKAVLNLEFEIEMSISSETQSSALEDSYLKVNEYRPGINLKVIIPMHWLVCWSPFYYCNKMPVTNQLWQFIVAVHVQMPQLLLDLCQGSTTWWEQHSKAVYLVATVQKNRKKTMVHCTAPSNTVTLRPRL